MKFAVGDFDVRWTNSILQRRPKYSVAGLYVSFGPYNSQASHEHFLRRTFGSTDWLWGAGDEYRFGKEDYALCGVMLATPEEEPPGDFDPFNWLERNPVHGNLVAYSEENFDAPRMEYRWVADGGQYVVCANGYSLNSGTDVSRIRVANSFDLVFHEKMLAGWILENPSKFLVESLEDSPTSDAPAELDEILHEHLKILTGVNINAMQDQNPAVFNWLTALRSRAMELHEDARGNVIINHIDDLLDNWYT